LTDEAKTKPVLTSSAGKGYRVPVTLGLDDGTSVEVLAGLGPGDVVVIHPPRTLEDGTPVLGWRTATATSRRMNWCSSPASLVSSSRN
jgi:hypothetical protein